MSQLTAPSEASAVRRPASTPSRRVLVSIAGAFLVLYAVLLGTGTDLAYDAKLSDITDHYRGISEGVTQASAYVGMVFVALLLFFGAAVRNAIRGAGGSWFGDVVFLGFGALAGTVASWVVVDVALWKAVDHGDESAIRALVSLSDAGFLPLMASMVAIYVGSGLAGLTTGCLPKWLAIASLVVGVIAPIDLLGFVGAMLLPVWAIAVSLTLRAETSA
jgi:hypothetical protein